jgi:hypothetical protein
MEFILAFALYWVIFLVGMCVRRRWKPTPNLVCGCTHHLAQHNPNTGDCNVTTVRYRNEEEMNRSECPCLIYTGDYPADWQVRLMQKELER